MLTPEFVNSVNSSTVKRGYVIKAIQIGEQTIQIATSWDRFAFGGLVFAKRFGHWIDQHGRPWHETHIGKNLYRLQQ